MRSLATAALSEGLTTRTSIARIFCHSSVVKVQRSGHDSPRRRAPMIGVCGHGVKPDDAPGRDAGSCWRHLVGGNGREYYWPVRKAVKRPPLAPESAHRSTFGWGDPTSAGQLAHPRNFAGRCPEVERAVQSGERLDVGDEPEGPPRCASDLALSLRALS